MVPRRGLEPPRSCDRQHLKLVRLPIPPSGPGCGFTDRAPPLSNRHGGIFSPVKSAIRPNPSPARRGLRWRPFRGTRGRTATGACTAMPSNMETLVTVFGGSGFLGRHVVRALAKRDYRIRVAVRRPDLAGHLQPLGKVGQIHAVQANLRYPASVEAAVQGADVSSSISSASWPRAARRRFDAVQAQGAAAVARAANAAGARLIHVSAIGADANSPSRYAQHQGAGRAGGARGRAGCDDVPALDHVRAGGRLSSTASPRWRASSPVLPLIGGGQTQFQPVFVGDVARAIAEAVDGKAQERHDLRTRRAAQSSPSRGDGIRARRPSSASACWCRCRSRSPS